MRTNEKTPGDRHYRNYTEENVANALAAVNNGMSNKLAAATFQIPRSTLVNNCLGRHTKSVGIRQTFTHEEEQFISKTLVAVPEWGFPLTKQDIKMVIKQYIYREGSNMPILTNNTPGYDMIKAFTQKTLT